MNRLKTIIAILLLLPSIAELKAQFNNNHWAFGDSVYIDWTNASTPIVGSAAFNFRNGSASIGDSLGLLVYAGLFNNWAPLDCYIWNKYHQRIGDSTRVKGGLWYHSSLFIPYPGNDSLIYLFTLGVTSQYGFYSNTINFKANNDSGMVLQKNFLWNNFPAFDALMGVRHGNGRDWWVISQRCFPPNFTPSNTFYFYLVSPTGISVPFIQSIGSTHSTNAGHLVFSNGGSQFANVSIRGLIELYSFDRCTGTITSTNPIEQEPATSPYPNTHLNCAFSPSNERLYVMSFSQISLAYYIYQYDLTAPNIAASKTVIDSFSNPSEGMGEMRLAPDGKIYVACFDLTYSWPYPDTITAYTTYNNNLSVINYPDSLGAACDFQPFSFNLGTGRSYFGLPNNPDFELGAWVGSPCDTLSVGVDDNVPQHEVFFQAWYNSEWNMIHVNASKLKGNKATLRLVDVEGRLVYEKETGVIAGGYVTTEINMQGIAKGMYIVNLLTEKEYLSGKVMK